MGAHGSKALFRSGTISLPTIPSKALQTAMKCRKAICKLEDAAPV